jgi:uncharacterized phage protein (TIGR01671 family)
MNREIKFRTWDKEKGTMHGAGRWFSNVGDLLNAAMDDTSQWELMQFTGLKDKNGKEIYEGDILGEPRVGEEHEYIGKVVYDDDFALFVIEKQNGGFEYLGRHMLDHRNHEVIGNIYENSNLLEENSD